MPPKVEQKNTHYNKTPFDLKKAKFAIIENIILPITPYLNDKFAFSS